MCVDVLADRVVGEVIEAAFAQAAEETAPAVLDALPAGQPADLAVGVEVDFLPLVAKPSQPGGTRVTMSLLLTQR